MINPVQRDVVCANGRTIVATFYEPKVTVRAALLIVPGMGVSQRYYAACASWLASHGFLTATFDFSGIGLSRRGALRELDVNIVDWARFECAAMIDALKIEAPDSPMYWLGHSLGGQIIGFVPNRDRVDKLIIIASGTGYWIESPPALRWRVWSLWYVVAPLSVRLAGYFPGKFLRMIGDLPRGVMEQWRRWCMHPDYAVGVEGEEARSSFAALEIRLCSISFTDDEFMSARNTEALLGFYRSAKQHIKRIDPREIGVERIGHFGFFNPRFEHTLWREHLLPELQD